MQSGSSCFTLLDLPSLLLPCKKTETLLWIAPLIMSSSLTLEKSKLYKFENLVSLIEASSFMGSNFSSKPWTNSLAKQVFKN